MASRQLHQNALVTGGAGVIGSAMAKRLLSNHDVIVIDDLSSGSMEHLSQVQKEPNFLFRKGDVRKLTELTRVMDEVNVVFHFAANADVRFRPDKATDVDLKTGTIGTYNVLESMRIKDASEIVFSSSSTVYGTPTIIPTPEDYGPLMPESLYGASKLACEGLISAFASTYGIKAWIYRFANIVGTQSRIIGKNVIPEFIEKLRINKRSLRILGDGEQTKSYLYIDDCIDGMLALMKDGNHNVALYNLGSADTINVKGIADIIVDEMGLKNVEYSYTGGTKGWKGDIPLMFLDVSRAEKQGWKSTNDSKSAVRLSARALLRNSCL